MDLEQLLKTQQPARLEIEKELVRKGNPREAYNICLVSKKFQKLEICQKEFWNRMLEKDTRKYSGYNYILNNFMKKPDNLREAINRYYSQTSMWKRMEDFLNEWSQQTLTKEEITEVLHDNRDPFYNTPATLIYLMLLNKTADMPGSGLYAPDKKILLSMYMVVNNQDLTDQMPNPEAYFYALWALHAFENGDRDFLNELTLYEDFWSPETFRQICQIPTFSEKTKQRLLKQERFNVWDYQNCDQNLSN